MARKVEYRRYKTARKTKNTYYPFVLGKYGNYVGPGWSDGKYQNSVAYGKSKPVDKFDNTARSHDTKYALGKDLNRADEAFYAANIGRGPRRTVAAVAVMTQRKLRGNKQTSTEVGFPTQSSFPEKDMAPVRKRTSSALRTPSPPGRGRSRSPGRPVRRLVPRSALTSTPGFMKGGRRKSKRSSGASSSRSAGKLSKGRKTYTPEDKFSRQGVLVCREGMAVVSTTAIEKAQSIMVGHANYTTRQLKADVAYALTKWFAIKLGYEIQDFSTDVPLHVSETFRIFYFYKTSIGGVEANGSFDITGGTFEAVQANFFNMLNVANGQSEHYWTRIQCSRLFGGVLQDYKFRCDMARMKVQLYAKSSLKIQNRTINASGNSEADDVDNVPLYGKMYSGNGNYIFHQDVTIGPPAALSTLPAVVVAKFQIGSPLCEPQPLSFIKKANKISKVHLDPGQIKTSVLVFKKNININVLTKLYARSGADILANFDGLSLGKFSFVHVEKMIQAVATTDVNAMNIAYEVDTKSGCIITAPKIRQTNVVTLTQLT